MRIPAIMMTTLVSLLSMDSANACTDSPKTRLEIRQDVGIDKKAKLIWKRCALGMHWSAREKTCRGEADAFTHSEAEVQAAKSGQGWRLPTVDELATLLQTTCSGPQLEKGLFPDIEKADFGEGENFWSSTQAFPDMYYFFDLGNGYADIHSANYALGVLLVKDL